ncbi:hypothetical protein [Thiomicrorhabdus aquaedulcis]|nr:hypothetical protein [Thiomicrorhabdus aquaedulcis]
MLYATTAVALVFAFSLFGVAMFLTEASKKKKAEEEKSKDLDKVFRS